MKKFVLISLCAALMLGGCAYKRDGDQNYVIRYNETLPTVRTTEADSVMRVAAMLIAKGQVVRECYELKPIEGIEQACAVRTNGMNVEIYRLPEDSALTEEIRQTGQYPLKDDEGNVLAAYRAAVNGRFVLMIPSDVNPYGEDMTELNDKLEKRFLELKL